MEQAKTAPETEEAIDESTEQQEYQPSTLDLANGLVGKNTAIAAGVGVLPFPVLDTVAITGLQLNLLSRLCKLYEVPFSKDRAKHIVAALLGGVGTYYLTPPTMSLLKAVPFVGHAMSFLTMPAYAGASTYAIGKIFIRHFESGGTFLTFDPNRSREYFRELFAEGEKVATNMKKPTGNTKKSTAAAGATS